MAGARRGGVAIAVCGVCPPLQDSFTVSTKAVHAPGPSRGEGSGATKGELGLGGASTGTVGARSMVGAPWCRGGPLKAGSKPIGGVGGVEGGVGCGGSRAVVRWSYGGLRFATRNLQESYA